jgi:hypothetical protein
MCYLWPSPWGRRSPQCKSSGRKAASARVGRHQAQPLRTGCRAGLDMNTCTQWGGCMLLPCPQEEPAACNNRQLGRRSSMHGYSVCIYIRPTRQALCRSVGGLRAQCSGRKRSQRSDVCVLVTPRSTANGTTGERKHIAGSSAVPVVSS